MSNSVNLSLDVTKTGIQNPLIKVRQGDGGFETLHTTVTSNGEPLDLQGWTITFMGTTAGNHKIIDGNVSIIEAPNGIFDYTPSKAWGMDIGDFQMAYFKFVKGDGSASSANFRVNVIEAVDLTQEEAQNYISVVDTTIAEINQHLTDSLANVTQSIADANNNANTVSSNVTALGKRVDDYNNKLSAVQVGSRNYILSSKRSLAGSGSSQDTDWVNTSIPVKSFSNKKIVVSVQVDYDNVTSLSASKRLGFEVSANQRNSDGTTVNRFFGAWRTPSVGDSFHSRIYSTFDLSNTNLESLDKSLPNLFRNGLYIQGVTGTNVSVSNPKIEIGNVPTDWTPAPEDADNTYVKKSGDTMTGALTVGGDPTQGGYGTTIKQNGGIELGASTAFIDFHGQNSTQDYTSRIYDDTTFAGAKVANLNSGNGASALLNTLALSSNRSFNLDTLALTVDGVKYGMALIDANIAFSSRSQITAPTLPSDMTIFDIDYGIVRYRVGPNFGWADMEMTNFWNNTTWKRTKRNGVWQPWNKIANDANVVHNTGTETIAGDKTFTGNTTLTGIKSSNVKTGSVALNGLTLDFRQTVVGVNVYMHGTFAGTFGTDQSYVTSSSVIPSNIDNPKQPVVLTIVSNGGVGGVTTNSPWELEVLVTATGAIQYRAKNLRDNDTTARSATIAGASSAFYTIE